jgi:hypothetical protein
MSGGSLDDLLLTVREVFDYVEGIALDYGGKVVLHLDYELVLVKLPVQLYEDYMDVILSLADRVLDCGRRGFYLFFTVDPEEKSSIVVRAKPLFKHRGEIYVGFRALGVECPSCRKPRIRCTKSI